ncbi:MAG: hypothetical protein RLZZ533_1734 [Cyanobacteriota bacterium]|jgi:hypothetical protein
MLPSAATAALTTHGRRALARCLAILVVLVALVLHATPLWAAPGLCIGPVCGDEITRSAKHHWQLRLRLNDQRGQWERITVDCRHGQLSPAEGPVERGHARAVALKACRLAGEQPA